MANSTQSDLIFTVEQARAIVKERVRWKYHELDAMLEKTKSEGGNYRPYYVAALAWKSAGPTQHHLSYEQGELVLKNLKPQEIIDSLLDAQAPLDSIDSALPPWTINEMRKPKRKKLHSGTLKGAVKDCF